jgi:hypothetical protein
MLVFNHLPLHPQLTGEDITEDDAKASQLEGLVGSENLGVEKGPNDAELPSIGLILRMSIGLVLDQSLNLPSLGSQPVKIVLAEVTKGLIAIHGVCLRIEFGCDLCSQSSTEFGCRVEGLRCGVEERNSSHGVVPCRLS